ncbi:MAG: hypothetical protein JNG86_22775 [Verrucomicrobiaceae bacterium]|nr:hypothetical protein [Verrucomicrobiaceae bacterium]
MRTLVPHRWLTWLLGIWEGLLFGWFVLLGYYVARLMVQVSEFVWQKPDKLLPRLSVWSFAVLPDEDWAVVGGVIGCGAGFGMICATSSESPASRLFRWTSILAATVIVGVALPVMSRFKNLSGGPDGRWWDDVLFFSVGVLFFMTGLRRLFQRSTS